MSRGTFEIQLVNLDTKSNLAADTREWKRISALEITLKTAKTYGSTKRYRTQHKNYYQ